MNIGDILIGNEGATKEYIWTTKGEYIVVFKCVSDETFIGIHVPWDEKDHLKALQEMAVAARLEKSISKSITCNGTRFRAFTLSIQNFDMFEPLIKRTKTVRPNLPDI